MHHKNAGVLTKQKTYDLKADMVLILDGISEICIMYACKEQALLFDLFRDFRLDREQSQPNFFSFMLAQHVLSSHLV